MADTIPHQANTVGGGDDMATPATKRTTSPAFQFYPAEFLSSENVSLMSMTERGVYITLLSHCWLSSGLSTDLRVLARLVGMKPHQFERMWLNGTLHKCFVVSGDRFQNPRLQREKRKQTEYREKQRNAAAMRWDKRGNAEVEAPQSSLSLSPSSSLSFISKKEKRVRAASPSDTTPTALSFPTRGTPPIWNLTEGQIESWKALYPGVDVIGECRRALAWVQAKGTKTASGMPAFLVRWLNRSVDNGRAASLKATGTDGRGRTGAPAPGKYDGIEEHD